MKKNIPCFLFSFALFFSILSYAESNSTWPSILPKYDHIVVVIDENKDYDQVIGNPGAPYINEVLAKEGAVMTQMFGEEHPSQGNYFWLLSGNRQRVSLNDSVPNSNTNELFPFSAPNLATSLIDKGYSFKGYSESMPEIGYTGVVSEDLMYARKHNSWVSFSNIPNGKTVQTSSNLRWSDFPINDFNKLPTVSFVVPNLINDMHNGPVSESVPAGDRWLKKNINAYYQWAKTHNSLLIFTFDENDDKKEYLGLTNPSVKPENKKMCSDFEFAKDLENRTLTIFAGAHIKHGYYSEGKGITHINILRTIEDMYGLKHCGYQQTNAKGAKFINEDPITDIFETTT